ncbi:MAG: ornithine carbamoyltransferase [Actinobacteria bacterium]|nr:MAG: ornithine carbamoyltransferase [Actinomycetota bacterium]
MTRHFLEVDDLDADELDQVLEAATIPWGEISPVFGGRGAALLFEKPSLRTRNSMELAVAQLGGHPVTIFRDEAGIDSRETAEDVARVLSRYHAVIAARVFEHGLLERLASASRVPVVNMLSDDAHPCQTLADLLTLRQRFGVLKGRVLAYVGDGNNVCTSLMLGSVMEQMEVRVATPSGYAPPANVVERARDRGDVIITEDPLAAVRGADAIYTDVWASMGQEDETERRRQAFAGFTVDDDLMDAAAPDAVFLHCLPAHRGEEVSASVLEGPQSLVWQQAENRLHAQRGLLYWLLAEEL